MLQHWHTKQNQGQQKVLYKKHFIRTYCFLICSNFSALFASTNGVNWLQCVSTSLMNSVMALSFDISPRDCQASLINKKKYLLTCAWILFRFFNVKYSNWLKYQWDSQNNLSASQNIKTPFLLHDYFFKNAKQKSLKKFLTILKYICKYLWKWWVHKSWLLFTPPIMY